MNLCKISEPFPRSENLKRCKKKFSPAPNNFQCLKAELSDVAAHSMGLGLVSQLQVAQVSSELPAPDKSRCGGDLYLGNIRMSLAPQQSKCGSTLGIDE